ncbi:hypothetical protein RRG08_055950 [Elysia crispata]|uniref:Uncharacterized protein n=1 Tax=Elysia crispata TaxID=231223 RepID=A0AAE1AI87_9GAST|nr:hypothetical protein RRG08_055950 [Elysia crispata]
MKRRVSSGSPSASARQRCCSSQLHFRQAAPSITTEEAELKAMNEFKYSGNVISNDGSLHKEINEDLQGKSGPGLTTNPRLGAAQHTASQFNDHPSWILKIQLRWTGHVIRMEPDRIPRQLLYGELSESKRQQGRLQKRYKDNVEANLAHA